MHATGVEAVLCVLGRALHTQGPRGCQEQDAGGWGSCRSLGPEPALSRSAQGDRGPRKAGCELLLQREAHSGLDDAPVVGRAWARSHEGCWGPDHGSAVSMETPVGGRQRVTPT